MDIDPIHCFSRNPMLIVDRFYEYWNWGYNNRAPPSPSQIIARLSDQAVEFDDRGWEEELANPQTVEVDPENETSFIRYFRDPPLLKNIVYVTIATSLWAEFHKDFERGSFDYYREYRILSVRVEDPCFLKILEKMVEKVNKLKLPNSLRTELLLFIRPLGLQLLHWHNMIEKINCDRASKIDSCKPYDLYKGGAKIYWTMWGSFDKVKSLKELIIEEYRGKNYNYLYQQACKYCLEEYIADLWSKIPPNKKAAYTNDYSLYEDPLIAYWTAIQKKEMVEFFRSSDYRLLDRTSIVHNMVRASVIAKNPFAFKYFWPKLSIHEKTVCLKVFFDRLSGANIGFDYDFHGYNAEADIMCYLFSHVRTQKLQTELFKSKSLEMLVGLFTYWPLQFYFLPTIITMMEHISEETYVRLMNRIADEKLKNLYFRNVFCSSVFDKLWFSSPLKFQIAFIMHNGYRDVFKVINTSDVQAIFDTLEAKEKKQFIIKLIEKQSSFLVDIDQYAAPFIYWALDSLVFKKDFDRNGMKPNRVLISLVKMGNYEYVRKFLIWFYKTEVRIEKVKTAFVSESNFINCKFLLNHLGRRPSEEWHQFHSYFLNTNKRIKRFSEVYRSCVVEFLAEYGFEFASCFLNWCFASDEKIKHYKNDLISERGPGLFLRLLDCDSPSWKNIKNLIKWFSPLSSEAVEHLKSTLNVDSFFHFGRPKYTFQVKQFGFFYLLDNFAESGNTSNYSCNLVDPSYKMVLDDIKKECDDLCLVLEDVGLQANDGRQLA